MSKALSLICTIKPNGRMHCAELHYPVQIEDVARALDCYTTPCKVENLVHGGDIEHLSEDYVAQTGTTAPELATAARIDLAKIMKNYPYVYVYNEYTEQWYFCHATTENYKHSPTIPLSVAVELQQKSQLFQLNVSL